MSLKQKCKFYLVAGAHVKMYAAGMEFEGNVIEIENSLNPNDAHVSLRLTDGNIAILPLNNQTTFVVVPSAEEETEDDELKDADGEDIEAAEDEDDELEEDEEDDKPQPKKKVITKKVTKKK